MANIWVAAAWVFPLFAGAAGALLFGYLRFLRWSQADDRQAATGNVTAGAVRPLDRSGDACIPVSVAGSRAA
jgi:hypothetical protein